MKVNVETIAQTEEEQVLIQCHEVTASITEIVDFLKSREISIEAFHGPQIFNISLKDIYYIEAVDNKVFAYLESKVYELKSKLYELESGYEESRFFRCSKSVIVNLMKVHSIKPALNGRFLAKLANGESVIISRQYVPQLKERLKGC
ncbi:MAG: LytTR family DNA-binding domain-containing protein [Desulfitobacterium sp.]